MHRMRTHRMTDPNETCGNFLAFETALEGDSPHLLTEQGVWNPGQHARTISRFIVAAASASVIHPLEHHLASPEDLEGNIGMTLTFTAEGAPDIESYCFVRFKEQVGNGRASGTC